MSFIVIKYKLTSNKIHSDAFKLYIVDLHFRSIHSVTGPRAQGAGGHSPGSGAPPGQAEAGRTQDSQVAPAPGRPELYRSAGPPLEHPGPCTLGAAVVTAGADSRAAQLAAPTVVVPPGVTLYLGLSRGLTDKQLPLSHTPGRGLGSSPGAHTRQSAQQAPPSEDQLEGQGKSKVLTKQHWKVPGEAEGFTVYRIRGYSPLFFVLCFPPPTLFPLFFLSLFSPFSSTTCFWPLCTEQND